MMESVIREWLKQALAGDSQAAKRLLDKALAGDEQAKRLFFADLIHPIIERRLGSMLVKVGGDRAALGEHMQEVMLHLLNNDAAVLRRWDPERGALAPYLARVAENHLHSQLRRRSPPAPSDETDRMEASGPTPKEGAMFSRLVRRLLREMTDSEVELFRMIYLEELSPDEAAAQLGISREAVHKRIQRLRARLIEMLSNPQDPGT